MGSYNGTAIETLKIIAIAVCFFVFQGQFLPVVPSSSTSVNTVLMSLMLCAVPAAIAVFCYKGLSSLLKNSIELASVELKAWVNNSSQKTLQTAVILIAGLTLFLELVLIRWQTGLFPVFALYKNFILLACFCGIGIGYARSDKLPLLLPASLPILAISMILLIVLRSGADDYLLYLIQTKRVTAEMLSGISFSHNQSKIADIAFYIPTLLLLSGTFLLNVLILLPISQFCGFLMERIDKPLTSYGCNLLGSVGGVIALFIVSWFWTGPVIWFGISAAVLLWYMLGASYARNVGLISTMLCILTLAWPTEPMVHNIYSPYQIIQKSPKSSDGLTWFMASGSYHQGVVNLSINNANRPYWKKIVGFWELPYKAATSLDRVLIIGAGIGNDASAALRSGAQIVDAVEIDPAIIEIGKAAHPERPYYNQHVHPISDDGRGFVRHTKNKYNGIFYGSQDTTIILSHGASVRFDTFIFTQEGIQEAYHLLEPGGLLSMGFVLKGDSIVGHKIYKILNDLPKAGKPAVYGFKSTESNEALMHFMVKKGADIDIDKTYLEQHQFTNFTEDYIDKDNSQLQLPSDDWPFFLMETRSYPVNYIISLCLVLLISGLIIRKLLPGQTLDKSLIAFFCLGAGFMLVETKAITELALLFGNTWQVIALTITSVLIMAYLANLFVAKFTKNFSVPAFICLLIVILVGYIIAINGGVTYGLSYTKIIALVLLTSPMFFSGIIFSSLLKSTNNITGAMAYNIMGAMLGGLLEYNSLRFGYSSLYLIAFLLYAIAWFSTRYKTALS